MSDIEKIKASVSQLSEQYSIAPRDKGVQSIMDKLLDRLVVALDEGEEWRREVSPSPAPLPE